MKLKQNLQIDELCQRASSVRSHIVNYSLLHWWLPSLMWASSFLHIATGAFPTSCHKLSTLRERRAGWGPQKFSALIPKPVLSRNVMSLTDWMNECMHEYLICFLKKSKRGSATGNLICFLKFRLIFYYLKIEQGYTGSSVGFWMRKCPKLFAINQ